ncbi:hypothetical protein HDV00_010591 [Rhizophlyctis rosea]|nr:hypothetical protein HDV00_010591 [Rhizophlyctis rosea]
MSVKPVVLNLYQKYYLPLGLRLKPCLKGLILGLLPILEEENNEYFDKGLSIMDNVSDTVGQGYFFHCTWLALITVPHLRLAGLHYLLKRMPTVSSKEDVAVVLGNETGLLAAALSAMLEDKAVLVQRGVLELLVVHFPLEHRLFRDDDSIAIIRSAVSVVSRRDMSLNRRLYSWLLGKGEENEKEKSMIQANQDALVAALRTMFMTPSTEVTELTKPYRVLISLMDRPEIGQAVLDHIFFDMLSSLREHCSTTSHATELLQTAKMFFDLLDPFIVWKQLYHVVRRNPVADAKSGDAYHLVSYALEHVKFADDESRRVHMPFVLHTAVSAISETLQPTSLEPLPPSLFPSLSMCAQLLDGFAEEAYGTDWRLGDFIEGEGLPKLKIDTGKGSIVQEEKDDEVVVEKQIEMFYGPEDSGQIREDPFTVYKDFRAGKMVVERSFGLLRGLLDVTMKHGVLENRIMEGEMFTVVDITGGMIGRLAERVDAVGRERMKHIVGLGYDDEAETPHWVETLLRGCTEINDFGIVRVCVRCLFSAFRSPLYPVPLPKDFDTYLDRIVRKFWNFLAPEDSAYHEEITNLIWELTVVLSTYSVENVFVRLLAEEIPEKRGGAMRKFGVFYRLSEEKNKPVSLAFSRVLFFVLDSLRCDDVTLQRAGEMWVRSYVRNQIRLLDPILAILFHHDVVPKPATVRISGEEVPLLYYVGPFNCGQVEYGLATLAAVTKVGDRGFVRIVWNVVVDGDVGSEVDGDGGEKMTYGDLLMNISLRYLESEPSPKHTDLFTQRKMDAIHARLCDFLHLLIVRSEKDNLRQRLVREMHDVVVRKLLFCIFSGRCDLQPRLLRLWRAGMAVGGGEEDGKGGVEGSPPLFVRTILDALSVRTNRPVLQNWIDFILVSLPHFRSSFTKVLLPIIRCICEEISKNRSYLSRYIRFFSGEGGTNASPARTGEGRVDTELPVLLFGLERVFAFFLEEGGGSSFADGSVSGGGGDTIRFLTDYVNSVVWGETTQPEEESVQRKVREFILLMTPGVFRALEEVYAVVISPGRAFDVLGKEVRGRVLRVFEVVFGAFPVDALEAVVEVWFAECGGIPDDEHVKSNNVTIQMMHSIQGCGQVDIVNILLESLRNRAAISQGGAPREKTRRLLRPPTLPDASIMLFLEKYCQYWADVQTLEETWSGVLAYLKDSFLAPGAYKFMFPSMLRLLTVYFDKLVGRPTFEDKRYRREAEDAYQKICDSCILIGGRAFDKGGWSGRAVPVVDVEGVGIVVDDSGNESGPIAVLPEIAGNLKRASKMSEDTLMQEIIMYLATAVFPSLRKFLTDQDRVLALFTNAMYYIVGPTLRNRQNVRLLLAPVLELICAMTKVPSGYKTWRKDAWDSFMDPRFFQMGLAAERKWRVIVQSAMVNEKERVGELLGRISAAPSSTLFVSKDQEALNRAHALRRLSFAIFCGPTDQYVPHLPAIQEKLVDILKVSNGGVVHCEAYLCLRVLLRRMTPKHLANIWPTVLTELIRLFGVYLRSQDAERPSEDLSVFFAACKFLDLLLVLGIDDFQWHQWIFVTETLELLHDLMTAQVRPVALVDKLSYKWTGGAPSSTLSTYIGVSAVPSADSDISGSKGTANASMQPILPEHERPNIGEALRRPLLTMRSIHDRKQLEPFVQSVSGYVYQTTYSVAKPDLDFIESMLESDFLDVEDAALGARNGVRIVGAGSGSDGAGGMALSPSPKRVAISVPARSSMDSLGGSPGKSGTSPAGVRGRTATGRLRGQSVSAGSVGGSDTEGGSDFEDGRRGR